MSRWVDRSCSLEPQPGVLGASEIRDIEKAQCWLLGLQDEAGRALFPHSPPCTQREYCTAQIRLYHFLTYLGTFHKNPNLHTNDKHLALSLVLNSSSCFPHQSHNLPSIQFPQATGPLHTPTHHVLCLEHRLLSVPLLPSGQQTLMLKHHFS